MVIYVDALTVWRCCAIRYATATVRQWYRFLSAAGDQGTQLPTLLEAKNKENEGWLWSEEMCGSKKVEMESEQDVCAASFEGQAQGQLSCLRWNYLDSRLTSMSLYAWEWLAHSSLPYTSCGPLLLWNQLFWRFFAWLLACWTSIALEFWIIRLRILLVLSRRKAQALAMVFEPALRISVFKMYRLWPENRCPSFVLYECLVIIILDRQL